MAAKHTSIIHFAVPARPFSPSALVAVVLSAVALTGCETMQHAITDGVATVGGAAVGAAVDPHHPVQGAAIGAAAGLVAGEGINYLQDKQKAAKYKEGYDKGRSDEVKALYWAKRDVEKAADGAEGLTRKYVEIPVPEHRTADGTVIEGGTRVMEVVE